MGTVVAPKSSTGQSSPPKFLCQVRRLGVDDPEVLQRRHHVGFDGGDHLRIQRLMQTEQGLAAQGVDPVAGAGRQAQLLARDEVFRQASLAAGVDLDVPVDGQRRPELRLVGLPAPGKGALPSPHAGLVVGDQSDLAPQGLDLGATVEAEDGAPFARRPIAQTLGVAYPRQGHEGQEKQDRVQAVIALGQERQGVARGQQTFLEQGRQGGENAA